MAATTESQNWSSSGNESKEKGVSAGSNCTNVRMSERGVSIAVGALAALAGLKKGSIPGILIAGVGSALIYRGTTGHCSLYKALKIDTTKKGRVRSLKILQRRGFHVQQSMLINKSAEELYARWRNLEGLPQIMSHLESVTVIDKQRSHWVAKAPKIAGGTVEWDAEIIADEPNKRIAWRSLSGGDVENAGEVIFEKALGNPGTTVQVSFDYIPPAGQIGKWVAGLFGEDPQRQAREDLHHFKQVMEIGEVRTTK